MRMIFHQLSWYYCSEAMLTKLVQGNALKMYQKAMDLDPKLVLTRYNKDFYN